MPSIQEASAFDTKLILVESLVEILMDLLSLAISEYTILPTDPVKEDGMFL